MNPCDTYYAYWVPDRRTIYVKIEPRYTWRFLYSLINHELAHLWHERHNVAFKRKMNSIGRVIRKLKRRGT